MAEGQFSASQGNVRGTLHPYSRQCQPGYRVGRYCFCKSLTRAYSGHPSPGPTLSEATERNPGERAQRAWVAGGRMLREWGPGE